MKFLIKNRRTLLTFLLISVIYFLVRLPNLTYQPVFADEAIYIRWAQVMKSEPTLRFLPLSDGKTPLFMWIMMPMFKVISDPLLAGRLLAVFSGFGSLIGVFILGWLFFSRRVGLFASFLLAITPYIFFFDRMALVDSLLSMFTIWSFIFALLLVKYKRIDVAMCLGYLLGAGLLTKTPGMFNLLVSPLAVFTLDFSAKDRTKRILKVFGLFILSLGIGLGIYNSLRLGPGFPSLSARNSDYVRNPLDLLSNPLDPFIPHFRDLVDWWPSLLGYPVILAIGLGIIFAFLKRNKFAITVILMSLVPLVVQMVLLRTFTGRYLLFSMPGLIVIAAIGLDNLLGSINKYTRLATFLIIILFSIWPIYFTNKLLFDIENAPIPKNERRGYLEDWTAGYGLREMAVFLNDESKKGLVIIGTGGSFGTLPDGIQIYFDKNTNVAFKPGGSNLTDELRAEASKSATYFIVDESRFPKFTEGVELIKRYPRPTPLDKQYKQDAMVLYKVLPREIEDSK